MTMYTDGFKEEMVRRLVAPPGMPVRQLAAQTGVSKSQLWKWKWKVAKRMTAAQTGEKKWPRLRSAPRKAAWTGLSSLARLRRQVGDRSRDQPEPLAKLHARGALQEGAVRPGRRGVLPVLQERIKICSCARSPRLTPRMAPQMDGSDARSDLGDRAQHVPRGGAHPRALRHHRARSARSTTTVAALVKV